MSSSSPGNGLMHVLQASLRRRGYRSHFKYSSLNDVPGFIVVVVDPHDPNETCFCQWLSFEDLEIVNKANSIFWRFFG